MYFIFGRFERQKTHMARIGDEELEMFALFEMTPDLVCIAGKDGFFRKINPAVCKKLGYTKKELLARPIFSFMHPDDRERTGKVRERLLKGKNLVNFQNRYCTKKGQVIWLEWTSIYVPDKEIVFAIAKDISSRKQLENEIEEKYKKFKNLAFHFKNSMEQDRKSLAIGLHEELAQLATVVKLDLDSISTTMPDVADVAKNTVLHARATTELLINTIRRLSFAVSPNMLEDVGLHEVMKWLCREFSTLNGIRCGYESTVDETTLAYEVQLDIFRICQEALCSVLHLAAAKKLIICIEAAGDAIRLAITDEGKGFELKNEKQIPGLTGIRERVASINGHLNVENTVGEGTGISVLIARE
jgi:PAS domain S-box-containing protein